MPRPQSIRIQVRHLVRMEDAGLLTPQDHAFPWWIRQSEDAPLAPVIFAFSASSVSSVVSPARRTDNRHALRQHHLITGMSVQVPAAHEARLRGVGVDPAEDDEVRERIDVIEQVGFVRHLARVRGGGLAGNDEFGDEEGIGEEGAG